MTNLSNLFAIASIAVLAAGCGSTAVNTSQQSIAVRTVKVATTTITASRVYSGTIEEESGSLLSFPVGGTLNTLNVKVGQRVAKGSLIAEIDDTSLANTHRSAQATLEQARDAYERMRQLHEKGSLPEIQWVEIQTQLSQAESAEKIARKNLDDCRLIAPFSGIISEKNMELGQNVMPGEAVVKLVKIGTVKVCVAVPENEIADVAIGSEVTVNVPALGNTTFSGRIVEKGIAADVMSRSYEVKASIANTQQWLMPGMLCSLSFTGSSNRREAIVIPPGVVRIDEQNRRFVWLNANGKAAKRVIVTGCATADGTVVESGLSAGDEIIVEGVQKVTEGTLLAETK